jgi:energy-coupling factor transport system permease protein
VSIDVHPVAWWLWSIGLAAYASFTTNPYLLGLAIVTSGLVVAACRGDQPWARSYRLYVGLGVVIVLVRVAFRVIFSSTPYGHLLVDLPQIPLPHWAQGITLFGPVTRESLLAGFEDGLRLATIVICLGAANALANPKRLLRSLPSALYEIGTALVVAVTFLPQLAESVQRVRRAQQLRPDGGRRHQLEDALERSMSLAAGMDTRGYGRVGDASRVRRRLTSALLILGLMGMTAGTYGILDTSAPRWLAGPMVIAGVLLAFGGLWLSGRTVGGTVYRPHPWGWREVVVIAAGLAVGAAGWWINGHSGDVAYPDLSSAPQVTLPALAVLIGLVPSLVGRRA